MLVKDQRMRAFLPMTAFFIVLNGFFVSGHKMLERWNIDQSVVIVGNLVLFVVTLSTYLISLRALRSPNPQSFVRAMYGSFLIKLFACVIAVLIYILAVKKDVNKPAIYVCMGLYLIYTFLEVKILTKLLKKNKNA